MAGVVPMTKRNIICVLVCVIILLLIIVFIPYPQRINKVVPAYIDKENTYTMSIKAWKLNYLFKTDKIITEIKINSDDEVIYDNSENKVKVPVLYFDNGDTHIGYISFNYYDSETNSYKAADIWWDFNKEYLAVITDKFTCVAPAENLEERESIINYFEENNCELRIKNVNASIC